MSKIKIYNGKSNNGNEKGLFAHFFSILNALADLKPDEKLYVDLSKSTSYYDKSIIETDNVWEYFFEQPFNLTKEEAYKAPIEVGQLYYKNYNHFGLSNGKYDLSYKYDKYFLAKEILSKHIKIKKNILDEFEVIKNNLFENKSVFGIHVRSNEHYKTGHAKDQENKMPINFYFDKIESKIQELKDRFNFKFSKLFLATDNQKNINLFMNRYSDILIRYDSLVTPADSFIDNNWLFNEQNYKKGKDVLFEILLLSHCKYKLLSNSNVSCATAVMSDINSFEFIDMHVNFY